MGQLDLSAIEDAIHAKDPRGERSYSPQMMTTLLKVPYEWGIVATCHNLLELFRAGERAKLAAASA